MTTRDVTPVHDVDEATAYVVEATDPETSGSTERRDVLYEGSNLCEALAAANRTDGNAIVLDAATGELACVASLADDCMCKSCLLVNATHLFRLDGDPASDCTIDALLYDNDGDLDKDRIDKDLLRALRILAVGDVYSQDEGAGGVTTFERVR